MSVLAAIIDCAGVEIRAGLYIVHILAPKHFMAAVVGARVPVVAGKLGAALADTTFAQAHKGAGVVVVAGKIVQWLVTTAPIWTADIFAAEFEVVTKPFIRLIVAVVVLSVTDFEIAWIVLIVEGAAVHDVGHGVIVVIVVTGVTGSVVIIISLVFVGNDTAVVLCVDNAVVVVVVVNAVGKGVAVCVHEAIIDGLIAVVI